MHLLMLTTKMKMHAHYPSDDTPMRLLLLAQCGVVTRGQEYDNQLGDN